MATDNPPINEDDDLFNFDEMNRGSSRAAVASTPLAAAPASSIGAAVAPVVVATAPQPNATSERVIATASAAPLPQPAPAIPSRAPPGQLPLVKPVVVKAAEPKVAASRPAPAKASVVRQRPAALTLALLAGALLVNVVLVCVVWRSMTGLDAALRQVGESVAHANDSTATNAAKQPSGWQDLEIKSPNSKEGEVTLAAAAEEVRRGEFERARARLYSLLSVIDRFDAAARPNLAARAQVLAADAYREQADALEHKSIASQAEPAEKHP